MSDNQVIPEAAVEAAARAIFEGGGHDVSWEGMPEHLRWSARSEALEALEAIGVRLLEATWATAYRQGVKDERAAGQDAFAPATTNPYRTAK